MAINAYAQYQQNQVNTASAGNLLLMAYDGAIRFARIAADKMKANDLYAQNEYIKKSQAIIIELASTIDPKPNPQLAANLSRLYDYMIQRLIDANIESQTEPVDEVIRLLTDLRGAWADIVAGQGAAVGAGA